jgi:type IV secretory pathway VirB2 component (pilin)
MRKKLRFLSSAAIAFVLTAPAYAAGSGMPWEEPLQRILESVQGPVAKIVAVIIIIITGLTLAFGDAASSFFLSFFSFGGGALV